MQKISIYFFIVLAGLIGILLLSEKKMPGVQMQEPKKITAWGGGGNVATSFSLDEKTMANIYEPYEDPDGFVMPQLFSGRGATANQNTGADVNTENIFNPLRALLDPPLPKLTTYDTERTSNSSFLEDPYNFIPRGFIDSNISQTPQKVLTAEQKTLFAYGNTVGLSIRSFETSHTDTTSVLDAFFKDYKNAGKAATLISIARDYELLADELSAIKNAPAETVNMHSALSSGYRELSSGLRNLTTAKNDEEMVRAIGSYNASAEKFIKNFVSLADLFASRGIKFSESDPGYIFQFNN